MVGGGRNRFFGLENLPVPHKAPIQVIATGAIIAAAATACMNSNIIYRLKRVFEISQIITEAGPYTNVRSSLRLRNRIKMIPHFRTLVIRITYSTALFVRTSCIVACTVLKCTRLSSASLCTGLIDIRRVISRPIRVEKTRHILINIKYISSYLGNERKPTLEVALERRPLKQHSTPYYARTIRYNQSAFANKRNIRASRESI